MTQQDCQQKEIQVVLTKETALESNFKSQTSEAFERNIFKTNDMFPD